MTSVQEIERAIDALAPHQIDELYRWLDQRYSERIDAQLKADLEVGRFDVRIDRAVAEYKAGTTELL